MTTKRNFAAANAHSGGVRESMSKVSLPYGNVLGLPGLLSLSVGVLLGFSYYAIHISRIAKK